MKVVLSLLGMLLLLGLICLLGLSLPGADPSPVPSLAPHASNR